MTTATATREAPAAARLTATGAAVASKVAGYLLCLLPGLLTLYFAFNVGGHGPDIRALALLLLALLLMGRIALVRQPFAGMSGPLAVAAGGLILLAAWTWLSSAWSDAPIRAFTEFQRTALYAAALIFFGACLRRRGSLGLMVKGIALAIAAVCVTALATRLYPDVYGVAPGFSPSRLGHPLGYWNALGIFAAVGGVLLLHLACDERGSPVVRALGAAGVPLAATTVYFTFSRGSIAAAGLGVVAYLLVARPRGAVAGLIATVPTTFVVLQAAYRADLLATENNATAAATAQGHEVAGVLLVCCAAAAVCRFALRPVDNRMAGIAAWTRSKEAAATGLAVLTLAGIGTAVAVDVPERLRGSWNSFTSDEKRDDARTRLSDTRVGSRSDHWDVALRYYSRDRVRGAGAGSFETQWVRSRPSNGTATDAHSLYIEVLSELGAVGLLLLGTALGAVLFGIFRQAKGQRRYLYGAIFAVSLMWIAHAGVDWDWELPAVSFWFFALAGTALARTGRRERGAVAAGWPLRVGAGVLCLLLAVGAVRMIISTDTLDRGISAFDAENCELARSHAQTSLAALGTQPQAAAILGYCDAKRGHYRDAVRSMEAAVRLDPYHWRYRYGLGIVRGLAGQDPRPDLRAAQRLNPAGTMASTGAAAELARSAPARWPRTASRATQPIE